MREIIFVGFSRNTNTKTAPSNCEFSMSDEGLAVRTVVQ